MLETFTTCEHPKMIYNQYIKEEVLVSCGKCESCRSKQTSVWVSRMMQESKCWRFTFSLYLDYNDDYLPVFDLVDGYLKERQERFWKGRFEFKDNAFPVQEVEDLLKEGDEYEREYFFNRLYNDRLSIPHASVCDIQNFKKRLNRIIQRECTGQYSNFRSCIAAELGPTTFRPHYHGILYIQDPAVASNLERYVYKAWSEVRDGVRYPFGHCSVEPDRGNTAEYISKYIKKPADLPLCYSHPALSTFFLTSRRPPIGSLLESSAEVRQIFHGGSCERVATVKRGDVQSLDFVPLTKPFENRLFPKCPLFGSLSPLVRTRLYKSVITGKGLIPDFESYLLYIYSITHNDSLDFGFSFDDEWLKFLYKLGFKKEWKQNHFAEFSEFQSFGLVDSDFRRVIDVLTDNWSDCNRLHTLYNCAVRVWYQSQLFGVSFDYYLSRIYLHYDVRKPLYSLSLFYSVQEEALKVDPSLKWEYFYPYSFPNLKLEKHPLSQHFFEVTHKKKFMSNRTKFKNMYFESLKDKEENKVLYESIKNYYYAKECYETLETIA